MKTENLSSRVFGKDNLDNKKSIKKFIESFKEDIFEMSTIQDSEKISYLVLTPENFDK